jgi:hypothetical protein
MVEETNQEVKIEVVTFDFPIRNTDGVTQMKNIPHSTLPNFHGLVTEDLDTFLFEFDVLCRSYDYIYDAHKLNLFPGPPLRMFPSDGSWDSMGTTSLHGNKMRKVFLEKYQDYCKDKDHEKKCSK